MKKRVFKVCYLCFFMEEVSEIGNWHAKSKEDIFKELKISEHGLTEKEAEKRIKEYGRNEIKKIHKLRPLKIVLEQFNSFLVYILIIAAGISFVISHTIDGIVISVIIIINTLIGFFQQYRAEKAIENLKKLIIPKAVVIRDIKTIEINSSDLVPGDIVILESGDKMTADCRIIESNNLQTNEAILTGESMPVMKFSKKLTQKTLLSEQQNMLFTGTQVVNGDAKAIVVSTGMNSVFGKIAEHLQEIETHKTPMQKRLDKFSKQIGIITMFIILFIIALGITKYFDIINMFMISVSLAVAAIPEGLPAIITASFAISSLLMSKKNVIVRRLPSVETLGSVTVICSDKTGTITEEKMHIQEIFSGNKIYTKKGKKVFLGNKEVDAKSNKELFQLLKTSILCNNAVFEKIKGKYEIIGEPTESALLFTALDLGFNKKIMTEAEPRLKEFEFDSKRKMMSILRKIDNGRKNVVYTKGAPEKILEISTSEFINGEIKELTEKRKIEIMNSLKRMESDALRVLGFAYNILSPEENLTEKNMIFLGFMGMIDPPRAEVKEAIRQCKDAWINVKIITGDSALTAIAIAKQVGITGKSLTEEQLEKMSDEQLSEIIRDIVIFARITPKQKLRITKILQEKNEIVAITGDGINDVLALKSADVGIAMGIRGTDVARDVSDIVLINDNFASIVEGIKEGRKTYDNIKKFTKYFLAVNFSEIFLVLITLVLGMLYGSERWFLPLLPLQILWMNLVTDAFPAFSLIFERQDEVMKTKPRKEESLFEGIWKFVIVAGIFLFMIEIILYVVGVNTMSPAKTRTMILTMSIVFQLVFVYTCRTDKFLPHHGIFSNKIMNYAVVFSFLIHLILLYTPLGSVFGVIPLSIKDWILIIPLGFSGIIAFEGWKFFNLKRRNKFKPI